MIPERTTALVAFQTFLIACRREWQKEQGPFAGVCPVPAFADMKPDVQRKFVLCMTAALQAAKPENVQAIIDREASA